MESNFKLKDELTQKIGVLTRRETEARIIAPFVDALIKNYGEEEIIPILEKMSISYQEYSGKNRRRSQELTNNFLKEQISIFKKR